MTSHLEDIYNRYRNAEFTQRLDIYLQFPELRKDFLEIDQKEKKTISIENPDAPARFSRLRMPAGLFYFGKKAIESYRGISKCTMIIFLKF